jgi:hypothetical protein
MRTFAAGGHCGIPMDAKSISVNVTVVPPASHGFLTMFPSVLSTDGAAAFAIFHGGSSGANVIVDVNGYFK